MKEEKLCLADMQLVALIQTNSPEQVTCWKHKRLKEGKRYKGKEGIHFVCPDCER